ncbi:serum paraoxonase/arylesterase 2-like isoform X1 [Rana temporaria]|uniref:serum paraoxonase/arylesterase 2-like isoform X1 n=1 Tax=Rana temporaria TaxID=8407 RepID=UPI001AACF821|nr:serum paraoxonase/arylesterase 2-like isoform X1 [Rana temporaria]
MGTMLKLTLLGVTLGFLGERIYQFCHQTGFFKEVELIDLPNCQLVKGIEYGSEDIHLLPNGLAFISSGLKHPALKSFAPNKPAEILLVDLNNDVLHPKPLQLSEVIDASSFNPHGLSVYIDERDGTVYLFVVNHPIPDYNSCIEIFKFDEKKNYLLHLKTIKHPLLQSVNDIVAVGPESFYATNDYYFESVPMKIVEGFFGLKWTNVVYYSPRNVREVAPGLYSGNGIAISNDKKFIYAVDIMAHAIKVYEKHDNWSLTLVKAVDVDTCPDNLFVDPVTGDIWTGAHPNAYKVFFYKDEDPPLSEVIRIQKIHSDHPIVTRVYVNNGSVIQGSSIAVVYKKKLIIGTIFHKALYCQLD